MYSASGVGEGKHHHDILSEASTYYSESDDNGHDQEDGNAGCFLCQTHSYLNVINNLENVLEGADLKKYERYKVKNAEQIVEGIDSDEDENESDDESEYESYDKYEDTQHSPK